MDNTPEQNKVFTCQNPDCGKKSCRLCKAMSHIPLTCKEAKGESEDETRKRTYIENKMSEALMRKCYKCKKSFVKTHGCNHMTCSCGAEMCYVCRKPWKNCNGYCGGTYHHRNDVARAAREAKKEMNMENDYENPALGAFWQDQNAKKKNPRKRK